jgi:Family of unknown function (DUF6247)
MFGMTSPARTSSSALPPLPLPEAKPREIRAALRPEFREQFDQDYREALAEASRTLDLEGVHDTVEHWRMRAWITRDPQQHRRVVRRATELLTGQAPPAGCVRSQPRPGGVPDPGGPALGRCAASPGGRLINRTALASGRSAAGRAG